jgi:hypothetical protein
LALFPAPIATIPVIPVRMTEAWLLGSERAIGFAAGNSNGTQILDMPPIRDLEDLSAPKERLYQLIGQASGLNARRRAALNLGLMAGRVPDYLDGFAHLEVLPAFRTLQ